MLRREIAGYDTPPVAPQRRVWCNRTLNLRAIRAVGYDMDYTLVHYRTEEWEWAAFEQARSVLADRGWPVEELSFDPISVIQGLAFDLERGNLVKATCLGYVIRAQHGDCALSFDEQRAAYSSTFVELSEPRWAFMNMFSLSEASLFAQIPYVGDHLFGDVHVSKETLRWRTALILREIEAAARAIEESQAADAQLKEHMTRKMELDNRLARPRLDRQRQQQGYAPGGCQRSRHARGSH